ncbi:MAG: Hsp20/alpha crystallin family protein [Bdellovibrionales bacterium]|nr:Hsp20/alpha crystallin family protein [Bdellovibrionales bacterium]
MYPNARGLSSFPSLLDQLGGVAREFDSFLDPGRVVCTRRASFPLTVRAREDGYEIAAVVPGVKKDQLELTVDKKKLTIAIEPIEKAPQEDEIHGRYLLKEHAEVSGSRAVSFPDEIEESGIEATLSDGILKIFVRKAVEAQPKKIEIR